MNPEYLTMSEAERLRLLVEAGCTCPVILLGWRPGVGPRCRMCGTVAALQPKEGRNDE